MPPRDSYEHLGWMVSPYSAKTRAFLRFKKAAFVDREPSAIELAWRVRRAVGWIVMPTLVTPEGVFVQDSSDIVDLLDTRFPEHTAHPTTPRHRFVSALLEVFGDEWLPMAALHFRWRKPMSAAFALREFGRSGLPYLPRPLQQLGATRMADQMRGYLPALGVVGACEAGCERFVDALIGRLDAHFATSRFVLGDRPCVGDFALYGPLFAHLYRDPGSTYVFAKAPHVVRWIEAMHDPTACGDFVADDAISPTLSRVLELVAEEAVPYFASLVEAVDTYVEAHPDASVLPRSLGKVPFVLGGARGTRLAITFAHWKLERAVHVLESASPEGRTAIEGLLASIGAGSRFPRTIRHKTMRRGQRLYLAQRRLAWPARR